MSSRSLLGLVILIAALPIAVAAKPYLYPASQAGWPSQWLDERDTAPYLAFHKAEAMRMESLHGPPRGRQTGNEEKYDARFYNIDLTIEPSTHNLTGAVLARVTVTDGPLTTLYLDLASYMTVTGATCAGQPATFTHNLDIVTIDLDRAYGTGETIEVTVAYGGDPSPGGYFSWGSFAGRAMVGTMSAAFGARTWWSCKDWSEDKPDSVHMRVVAPTGMITASNGALVSSSDDGAHSIYRWRESYPIATYLVSIASYPYSVYSDWYRYAPADSMEIKFFIFPDHVQTYEPVNALVKDMIGAYAGRFGEFPFLREKYGEAEFLWGGGMENQTCTSLGIGAFQEYIVAHELSHEWWGDMTTCRDFHHVWLNEGFATWCEAVWAEHQGGIDAYHDDMALKKYFGSGTIYVSDLTNWGRIFDPNLSYDKASWVLHMLRHMLGDDVFFAAMRAYRARYQYSTATTEDFRDICETVSGKNLHYFFQEWIYGEYYPSYGYTYASTPSGGGYDVSVTLEQTQAWQIFRMPVDVTIMMPGGRGQTFIVDNSQATQVYGFYVPDKPTSILLDKDDWILKKVEEPVVDPPFDRAILLVNGLNWANYPVEIMSVYQNKAFWGDYTIDFWDIFDAPAGGYPATLPRVQGHGRLNPETIGHYRNVIWVSDNSGGDRDAWFASPILPYLQAGGNLILMTRQGQQFVTEPFRAYLGLSWLSTTTIYDCISTYAGLTDIPPNGTQSTISTFGMTFSQPDSRLIYKVRQNFTPERGIGVWRKPVAGGTWRPDGAQLIFLSGRPYRWDPIALRTNVMYMLGHFFGEPLPPPSEVTSGRGASSALALDPGRPNPSTGEMTIRFTLPVGGPVRLDVIDVGGRLVRGLVSGPRQAGMHVAPWDCADSGGRPVPPGIYWARLSAQGEVRTVKLTILR